MVYLVSNKHIFVCSETCSLPVGSTVNPKKVKRIFTKMKSHFSLRLRSVVVNILDEQSRDLGSNPGGDRPTFRVSIISNLLFFIKVVNTNL